jgi:hypothetical protein
VQGQGINWYIPGRVKGTTRPNFWPPGSPDLMLLILSTELRKERGTEYENRWHALFEATIKHIFHTVHFVTP